MIKKLLPLIFFLSICLYAKADKLYWVGGYGNFNDPAHWSYTSGGNGGAKTPDLIDDVYFDQNSSLSTFIVKILGEAKVHDFIISERMNTLILESSSSSGLIVSGNLNLKGNINWQMAGKLNFIANNASIVDFGNVTPKNDVIFNGASTWNLKSNLITINEASIILKRGKLILNNTAISTKNLFKQGNDNFEIELNDALISVKEIVSTNSSLRISQQESQLFFPLNRNGFDELNRQHLDNLKLIDNYAIQSLPVTVTNITNCVCNGQCNGTATVTFSPRRTRTRSICSRICLSGWRTTDLGRVSSVLPSISILRRTFDSLRATPSSRAGRVI